MHWTHSYNLYYYLRNPKTGPSTHPRPKKQRSKLHLFTATIVKTRSPPGEGQRSISPI